MVDEVRGLPQIKGPRGLQSEILPLTQQKQNQLPTTKEGWRILPPKRDGEFYLSFCSHLLMSQGELWEKTERENWGAFELATLRYS